MIRTFRPWQIFERLGSNNDLHLKIPTVPGTTSRTVFSLETMLLIAAARIVNAKSIFEIGTCMGYTALHLAMNTEAVIESVDVDKRPLVWAGTEYERQICINYATTDDLIADQTDMVFIDADHSYEWVKKDSEFAFKCDPHVIVWHDYTNPSEPGVKRYLDDIAGTRNLIHVQDSWLCFWFKEDLN